MKASSFLRVGRQVHLPESTSLVHLGLVATGGDFFLRVDSILGMDPEWFNVFLFSSP